jgi:hypothetical protein
MLKLLADSKLVRQSLSSTVFEFYLLQSILPVTNFNTVKYAELSSP